MNAQNCIRWIWDASKGFRLRISMSGVLGVLNVSASLLFVAITKHLVDIATGQSEDRILLSICLLLGCMLVQLAISVFEIRLSVKNTILLKNTLRRKLFVKAMESIWEGKEKHHTGDLLNRLEEDVRIVTDTICTAIPNTVTTIIQLVAAFFFLLSLEASLAWTLVLIMPIALILSKVYMKKIRRLTKEIRTTDSQVQVHIQEHLQHRSLINSFEQSERSVFTLTKLQDTLTSQVMQRADFSLFSRTVVQAGFAAGYATAFLWGVFGILNGAVSFGMMTAFLQLVMQVQRPVVDLSRQIPGFVHTLTSIERLAELDKLPQEEKGDEIRLKSPIGLRMDNVCFSYPDGTREVINNFSHDFKPGSISAIVGETGVGKSTLIRLILALLQAQKGSISIYNERKQASVCPRTRCNFVYVPQGNSLMSGTIRDNLLLGNHQASEQQLKEALYAAVADFVFDLPDGINTLCGEGGMGLSEGQAQRIAIARALLRDGDILLLDEPSSALDSETQQTLINRLKTLSSGKTVIIITHRDDMELVTDEVIRLTSIK